LVRIKDVYAFPSHNAFQQPQARQHDASCDAFLHDASCDISLYGDVYAHEHDDVSAFIIPPFS
jgi:hypothetical protein